MKKHTHKYERIELGSNGYVVYKCILPGCPHHIQLKLALGRLTLCHGCDEEIMITKSMIQFHGVGVRKPLCDKCKAERMKRREMLSAIGELK